MGSMLHPGEYTTQAGRIESWRNRLRAGWHPKAKSSLQAAPLKVPKVINGLGAFLLEGKFEALNTLRKMRALKGYLMTEVARLNRLPR
ncbi:MAG: hypothetical protein H6632_07395 [Anaerolineales bacterium]|nr:hypothetical protein [Anaerolineales bacterium]